MGLPHIAHGNCMALNLALCFLLNDPFAVRGLFMAVFSVWVLNPMGISTRGVFSNRGKKKHPEGCFFFGMYIKGLMMFFMKEVNLCNQIQYHNITKVGT